MKTAERIRSLREDKDLTQTEIAEYLNTSQTVYSRYERNERSLPIEMLYELCDFYNVSADYILGRTDNPKTNK
ncbi:MAG: helix-turn-helix transcriptional regulator [Clostridia bacterium]|nr:helix-turn-helix transcriptional regulator [Clostridia bacterium]